MINASHKMNIISSNFPLKCLLAVFLAYGYWFRYPMWTATRNLIIEIGSISVYIIHTIKIKQNKINYLKLIQMQISFFLFKRQESVFVGFCSFIFFFKFGGWSCFNSLLVCILMFTAYTKQSLHLLFAWFKIDWT